MKKMYQSLCVILLTMVTFPAGMFSQALNGNYTLDNTQPVSATNFTSFTQLATALNANGVAGPVTVNVGITSGPYSEAVTFNQATGVSATNSITIIGNGRILTWSGTSGTRHTLALNGADHMFFHNLQVRGTGSTYALTVKLWNQANFNEFHGCAINSPISGSGSSLVPFSLSGSGTSATSTGDSGNGNVVATCTITGGYYCVVLAGNSGTPKNDDNVIRDCNITDFYSYGVYNYYMEKSIIRGNVIDRQNRTSFSTTYCIFLNSGSYDVLVEGNHIRKLFDPSPTSSSSFYGIYIQFSSVVNREGIIRNNIISDVTSNGTQYGIYNPGYSHIWILQNTVSMDSQNSNSATTYGIRSTTTPGKIQNNIISMTRGGSGTKYCIYAGSASAMEIDGNVFHVTSNPAYIGYFNGAITSFTAWQQTNGGAFDQHGFEEDPMFANPALMDYAPTNTVINNIGIILGVPYDFNNFNRSMVTPDPGAIEFYNFSCGGIPLGNAVSLPQVEVCPGMSLNAFVAANIYTYSGISYQWQASAFAVGGFTNIPGANTPYANLAPSEDTYYSVVITCTNGGGSVTATPALFNVANTTTNNVPYHEGFESLGLNNLPNCSWQTSSMTDGKADGATLTYTSANTNGRFPRTGSQFASFYYNPAGTNYYYSNGIRLKGGVTYSASLWFVTESVGYTNWSDLSILVGTTQSPSGLQQIVSTNGPAASNIYKNLSDTFQVAADGIYYVAVRATAQASGAQYLTWDDLTITLPCEVNAPGIQMLASNTVVCAGFPIHLWATGAASYTWSTGQNASNISAVAPHVLAPSVISYAVTGSDLLSGCTSMLTQNVLVNPSPQVIAVASDPMLCEGEEVTLSAVNADFYAWGHGPNGPIVTDKPTATTTYSVIGTSANGCYRQATVQVVVNPKPSVGAVASPVQLCVGESVMLTGSGADTYTWVGNGNLYVGGQVKLSPNSSTAFLVNGTDVNGCTGTYEVVVMVDVCAGLQNINGGAIRVYPVPSADVLNIESSGDLSYEVNDLLGKTVKRGLLSAGGGAINISDLPASLYNLRIFTSEGASTIRIIKQ